MKEYTNGKRTVKLTERAYNVIFKEQGYEEVKQEKKEDKSKSQSDKNSSSKKG